jgi:putative transposase
LGLILRPWVHTANVQDRAAVPFLEGAQFEFPRLKHVWVDQGYNGSGKTWIEERLGWSVEVVERSPRRGWVMTPEQELVKVVLPKTFELLPRRWVVERTIAWLTFCRRLVKDYEFLPESSECWIYASQVRLFMRRLARDPC